MKTVIVTGSQGFIGHHLAQHLLDQDYRVIGVDNYKKYGYIERPHDKHPHFTLINQDLTKRFPDKEISQLNITPDYIIALSAAIGGISYFTQFAYNLVATNDRINANTFDYAIDSYSMGYLKKIVYISSSMVYENCTDFPLKEHYARETCPLSTYGFNKLNGEIYCQGANEQYGLPYVICRPFNALGVGEEDCISGKFGHTHVLPDLVYKALMSKSNDPLEIYGDGEQIRHYTHASDVSRGIVLAMESCHVSDNFNISTPISTSVKELATEVWEQIHGCNPTFKHLKPFTYDVQVRQPCVEKAKDKLGFEASIPLKYSVAEVIQWMSSKLEG